MRHGSIYFALKLRPSGLLALLSQNPSAASYATSRPNTAYIPPWQSSVASNTATDVRGYTSGAVMLALPPAAAVAEYTRANSKLKPQPFIIILRRSSLPYLPSTCTFPPPSPRLPRLPRLPRSSKVAGFPSVSGASLHTAAFKSLQRPQSSNVYASPASVLTTMGCAAPNSLSSCRRS